MAFRSNFIKQVQELVDVEADGIIGPGTEAAIEAVGGLPGITNLADGTETLEDAKEIMPVVDEFLAVARGQVGVTEVDDPAQVSGYGGGSPKVPWCAFFTNWCLACIGLPGTGSGAASSFRDYGEGCEPEPGAIIGWDNPSHVAIIDKVEDDTITIISGNMSNAVKRHPVTPGWGFKEPPAFVRRIV